MRLLHTKDILIGIDDSNGVYYPIKKDTQEYGLTVAELENELKNQKIVSSQTTINLKANGISMNPLINEGDLLELAYCSVDQLKPGDVFSYISNGEIITHRIILKIRKKKMTKILEKGDNGMFSVIYAPQTLGKIIKIENDHLFDLGSYTGILLSRFIALYTLMVFSIYYLIFYFPLFLLELCRNKFNRRVATHVFNTKNKYFKLKRILAQSIYPLIFLVVNLTKSMHYARK